MKIVELIEALQAAYRNASSEDPNLEVIFQDRHCNFIDIEECTLEVAEDIDQDYLLPDGTEFVLISA